MSKRIRMISLLMQPAIQTETQKREEAVKGLQDKLTVANGQIENEKTTRENAVNDLQNQVTANKGDIADLQHKIVASGQAFQCGPSGSDCKE